MGVTMALPQHLWDQLRDALHAPMETAGVLTARVVRDDSGTTLLARALAWAPSAAYLERQGDGLALASTGWVPTVRAAAEDDAAAVFVHTHPNGRAHFSHRDDIVDASLSPDVLRLTGAPVYGSMVVGGTPDAAGAAVRITSDGITWESGTKLRVTGDRLIVLPLDAPDVSLATFDRQIRFFGVAGQQVLQAMHVAVVGAGGTGSAVLEQLGRLGVGAITVIDDDFVTDATVTRGYGTSARVVGKPKAMVLADHLRGIGLGSVVTPVIAGVQDPEALFAMHHADAVFCCVDGHGGRVVLNRWAYAHLAPVLDTAVLVAAAGTGVNIDGRITWLAPGGACLLCRGRLNTVLAYAEMLSPIERQRLAGQGYAPEIATAEPAIVTLTSLVASLTTTELLARLFGLADSEPTEILARVHERELRLNRTPSRAGCFCNDVTFWGRGLADPYLDLTWPG